MIDNSVRLSWPYAAPERHGFHAPDVAHGFIPDNISDSASGLVAYKVIRFKVNAHNAATCLISLFGIASEVWEIRRHGCSAPAAPAAARS